MEELVGLDGDFTGVEEVHVDINVLGLVAHEALSNARKYRDRHTPIRITAHVISKDDGPHAILSLRITSTNDVRVPRLSDKKCIAVFKTGVKANSLSSTSDGLGLNNAAVACRAAQRAGAKRVLCFDWDVHHGNGTQAILEEDENV